MHIYASPSGICIFLRPESWFGDERILSLSTFHIERKADWHKKVKTKMTIVLFICLFGAIPGAYLCKSVRYLHIFETRIVVW